MQTYGVALFYSTREAMKAEEIAKEAQLAVRIIPTPEKIHASCGFSLKYPLAEEDALISLLASAKIASEGFYHGTRDGLKTEYSIRKEK
ncbi:DUF3343 domain-containing protein [Tetragenococcus koreensis]|uniref:DUF3343 domain-containing protein n=1 Tax=Tetragenococcus koreensis TaxID=290335 RepID=UPI001F3F8E48|nr:DUF3343 domain-containing protein [Tetragenococcus koreensis]MDN6640150.1 DUF3343 domain-containing protein [Tetragenococcus sp.]MDN6834728.1 DUF3343 domain-containing protein [Lactococcus lactis]MDN6839649.1 DUF3343 domain-containing protein [Tetragenococcus halophilus]MCF1586177.1 DUF3343 domain-containing protein [Tetragenococcus koreensis]MCF1615763.1 DUF3343 domain-containing protein [Tetragenococcus koreensis]